MVIWYHIITNITDLWKFEFKNPIHLKTILAFEKQYNHINLKIKRRKKLVKNEDFNRYQRSTFSEKIYLDHRVGNVFDENQYFLLMLKKFNILKKFVCENIFLQFS